MQSFSILPGHFRAPCTFTSVLVNSSIVTRARLVNLSIEHLLEWLARSSAIHATRQFPEMCDWVVTTIVEFRAMASRGVPDQQRNDQRFSGTIEAISRDLRSLDWTASQTHPGSEHVLTVGVHHADEADKRGGDTGSKEP
jgi:hypothetical protein